MTIGWHRDAPEIDLRIFERVTLAQVLMPSRRGLSLPLALLPALATALAEAERQARALGLIGGGD